MRWLIIVALFTFAQVPTAQAQSSSESIEAVRLDTLFTLKSIVGVLETERKAVRQAIRDLPPGPDRVAAFARQAELNVAIFKVARRFFQAKNDRGNGPGFFTRLNGHVTFATQFVSAA